MKTRDVASDAILKRVEEVRRWKGLTKTTFAKKLDLTPQTYNNFTGTQGSRPSLKLILNLCRARPFGINAEWLLFGTGPMWRPQQPLTR